MARSIVPFQMRVSIVASASPPCVTQWLNQHLALMFSSAAPPSHAHPPPVVFPYDGPPISWESNFMATFRLLTHHWWIWLSVTVDPSLRN